MIIFFFFRLVFFSFFFYYSKMFKFVSSFLGSVLGKKRSLDSDEKEQDVVSKKQKLNENIIHRIKVSHLPERDISLVKKYFKSLGYNRFNKAPTWSYALITLDVKYIQTIFFIYSIYLYFCSCW